MPHGNFRRRLYIFDGALDKIWIKSLFSCRVMTRKYLVRKEQTHYTYEIQSQTMRSANVSEVTRDLSWHRTYNSLGWIFYFCGPLQVTEFAIIPVVCISMLLAVEAKHPACHRCISVSVLVFCLYVRSWNDACLFSYSSTIIWKVWRRVFHVRQKTY